MSKPTRLGSRQFAVLLAIAAPALLCGSTNAAGGSASAEVGTVRREAPKPAPLPYLQSIGLSKKGAAPAAPVSLPERPNMLLAGDPIRDPSSAPVTTEHPVSVKIVPIAPEAPKAAPALAALPAGVPIGTVVPLDPHAAQPLPPAKATPAGAPSRIASAPTTQPTPEKVEVGLVQNFVPAAEVKPVTAAAEPSQVTPASSLAAPNVFPITPAISTPALFTDGDIDWSRVTRLGDLVPTEREALYRRAMIDIDQQDVSARELISYLASCSGVEFMMSRFEDQKVTVRFRRNPFRALEEVVDNLGMGLIKRNQTWVISATDKTTLVSRTYKFKNIHLDREVTFRDEEADTARGQQQQQSTGAGGFSQMSGGYEKVTNRASSLPPRSAADRSKKNFVLDRIKDILGADPGVLDPLDKGALREKQAPKPSAPEPFYDPDANVLVAVCTEQKWQWISEFLEAIDQESYNILVEVTLVTTSKGDHKQMGVNWAGGTKGGFGNGIKFGLSGQTAANQTGTDQSVAGSGSISFGDISNLTRPAAILSASELEARLHFYATEGNSKLSKTIPFLVQNNREGVFNLTQNRPVAVSTNTQNNTSGGAIVSSGTLIQNEDIGVVIRVIPQRVRDGTIRTNAQIEITNVVGGVVINSIEYPLIQTSAINSSPILEAGYAAEIGGLEELISKKTKEKLPLLGDIPLIGDFLFSDVVKGSDANSLNLLIRVVLLDAQGNEVSYGPNGEKRVIPRQSAGKPRNL